MSTPPTIIAPIVPPCLIMNNGIVTTSVPIVAGSSVFSFNLAGRREGVDMRHWLASTSCNLFLPDPRDVSMDHIISGDELSHPILRALMERPAVPPPVANCHINRDGVAMTKDTVACTPLVLKMSPLTVGSQHVPRWLRSCCRHICDGFMTEGNVPRDMGGEGGRTALIDGYITIRSLVHLVCAAPYCTNCCVIGCGYGETLTLMALARQCRGIGFEAVPRRRNSASALIADLGMATDIDLHSGIEHFRDAWPANPTLIWCNNIRFNDDVQTSVPYTLLNAPSFPADGSTMITMVPFAGEETVPVCFCGGCYEGFLDADNIDGCYVMSATDNLQLRSACGAVRGFWDKRRPDGSARAILRCPSFGMQLVPFGAGSGVYESCTYQLFTSTVAPPTPHPGLKYGCIVVDHPNDLTDELCAQLKFVENSPVVDGPLGTCSAVFHGFEGEELGIDVAIAFTVAEPGESSVIYAYRTLSLVRQCGMDGVLRLNHDIIVDGMQGKSFINQINLQTAQIIRRRFSSVEFMVIEPDRDISYHINYTKNGFLWRLQDAPLKTCHLPSRFSGCSRSGRGKGSPYWKYRQQIDLDPQRYETLWFKVPAAGHVRDLSDAPNAKRTRGN